MEDAFELCDHMSGEDVTLDEITYATLINGLQQPNRCENQEEYGNIQKVRCSKFA